MIQTVRLIGFLPKSAARRLTLKLQFGHNGISYSAPPASRHQRPNDRRAINGETHMAKSRTGLDHRHRDKSGRIDRKHGNTRVAALRKEYGASFAKGRRKDMMLKTLLAETGSASLHDYLKHHHK
jgi:hypothetical protein